jgi:hypothetical protein
LLENVCAEHVKCVFNYEVAPYFSDVELGKNFYLTQDVSGEGS